MTDPDPTGARLEYLARVLANPPSSAHPCAADCGQPLTRWQVDAEGRRWHTDCLPLGTTMAPSLQEQVRQLKAARDEAQATVERVRAECDRIEAAVRAQPTAPDFDGAYLAAIRHIRNALNRTDDE